jgi:DNA-binding MarR family transcriptional regulator
MFRLEDSLGFLLNRAAFAMRRGLEQRLVRHGLTAPQWAVLARLWEEDGQSPSAIGKSLHFDRPTITGIVDRLEEKGLVRKTRDAEDRRVVRIHLTARGREMERQLPPYAREVNRIASKGMGDAEVERLKGSLRRIWENFKA